MQNVDITEEFLKEKNKNKLALRKLRKTQLLSNKISKYKEENKIIAEIFWINFENINIPAEYLIDIKNLYSNVKYSNYNFTHYSLILRH